MAGGAPLQQRDSDATTWGVLCRGEAEAALGRAAGGARARRPDLFLSATARWPDPLSPREILLYSSRACVRAPCAVKLARGLTGLRMRRPRRRASYSSWAARVCACAWNSSSFLEDKGAGAPPDHTARRLRNAHSFPGSCPGVPKPTDAVSPLPPRTPLSSQPVARSIATRRVLLSYWR